MVAQQLYYIDGQYLCRGVVPTILVLYTRNIRVRRACDIVHYYNICARRCSSRPVECVNLGDIILLFRCRRRGRVLGVVAGRGIRYYYYIYKRVSTERILFHCRLSTIYIYICIFTAEYIVFLYIIYIMI